MIRSVKIKPDQDPELESILPTDRVVEIDELGRCSLYDQQLVIADSQIEEVM
jgi:hypothetical protein